MKYRNLRNYNATPAKYVWSLYMFGNGIVISVYINVPPTKAISTKKVKSQSQFTFRNDYSVSLPINCIPFGKRKVLMLSITHIKVVSSNDDTHKHLGPRSIEV